MGVRSSVHGRARPVLPYGIVKFGGRRVSGRVQLRGRDRAFRLLHMCAGVVLPRVCHGLCCLRRWDLLPRQHDAGCHVRCGWLLVCRRQPLSQRDGLRCGALRHGGWCDDVPLERVRGKLHGRERQLLPRRKQNDQRRHVPDGVLVRRRR